MKFTKFKKLTRKKFWRKEKKQMVRLTQKQKKKIRENLKDIQKKLLKHGTTGEIQAGISKLERLLEMLKRIKKTHIKQWKEIERQQSE